MTAPQIAEIADKCTKHGKKLIRREKLRLGEVLQLPLYGLYARDPRFPSIWRRTPIGTAVLAYLKEQSSHAV